MKFIVEKKDIKEVKAIARHYYGVIVSDEKAKELIDNDYSLVKELGCGDLDTVGRSVLANAIVQDVLKEVPPVKDKHSSIPYWEWPINGSSDEYKAAFDQAFKENAEKSGYKLDKCWDK